MNTFKVQDDQLFSFERTPFNPVRAVIDAQRGFAEPYFFAHDIVDALKLSSSLFKTHVICQAPRMATWQTPEGRRITSVIDEWDAFKLIDEARKAQRLKDAAHDFELWLTTEMLPFFHSLKTGKLELKEDEAEEPAEPDFPPVDPDFLSGRPKAQEQEEQVIDAEFTEVETSSGDGLLSHSCDAEGHISGVRAANNPGPLDINVPAVRNEVMPFQHSEFGQVRVVMGEDGEPWFVATDVCQSLDIRTNTLRVILDADEVQEANVNSIVIGRGGRTPLIISESGLYSLILRSRKPEARRFRKWVTSEVLPAIRKHGGYLTPAKVEEIIRDPDVMIGMLMELKEARTAKEAALEAKADAELELAFAEVAIKEAKPKVDLVDKAFGKHKCTIYSVARNFEGINAMRAKEVLVECGYLRKVGRYYYVSRPSINRKYFIEGYSSTGHPAIYVTPDGVALLHKLYQEGRFIPLKKASKPFTDAA